MGLTHTRPGNLGCRRAQRDRAHHCYITAARVYDQRGWGLAEEHINFTLARQSFHLGRSAQALLYFVRLLNANSRQSVTQQTAYIREMVFIYKVRQRPAACNDRRDRWRRRLLTARHAASVSPGASPAQNFPPLLSKESLGSDMVSLETSTGARTDIPTAESFLRPAPQAAPLLLDGSGALWLALDLPKLHRRTVRITSRTEPSSAATAAAADEATWVRLIAALVSNDGLAGAGLDAPAEVRPSTSGRAVDGGSLGGRPICVIGGTATPESATRAHAEGPDNAHKRLSAATSCTEPLTISMTVENPLQVPLIMQSVRLQVQHRQHTVVVQKDPLSGAETVSIRPAAETPANNGKVWMPETAGTAAAQPAAYAVDVIEQIVVNPLESTQVGAQRVRRTLRRAAPALTM